MTALPLHTRNRLRAIGAVAAKDIIDAIRNKTVLAIIIGVATLVFSGQMFPLLTRQNDVQRLVVYATDREQMRSLRRLEDLQVSLANSPADLKTAISGTPAPVLGIALPEALPAGQSPLALTAYHTHWLSDAEIQGAAARTEQVLGELWGRPVQLQPLVIYPAQETGGYPRVVEFTFVTVLITICAALVPLLFMEEQETHTLEILRVAPLSTLDLVTGKAAAGLFYGVVAAAVVLMLNTKLILHWPVALLAALVGSLFAVVLGLLLGAYFENQGTMNMVMGVLMILLLLPPFLIPFLEDNLPGWAITILAWLPTSLLGNLLRTSMVQPVPVGQTAGFTLALLLMAVLLTLPIMRRFHRLDL